ncbi:hypothetical protein BU23DRAFT_230975 [Bimuria novae-zelandiae CBS 107.79]|uniref:Uncharacterized protein n=1 Tax=Bimuria novae-zelandiae CBS 107.79 TaxID=1447943 RepID=A0A6A5UYF7_9PLEO|nr:hypothetical protein BU23DRAFT_230975 [Bimuria novae-zelandiae CBS 107.79]
MAAMIHSHQAFTAICLGCFNADSLRTVPHRCRHCDRTYEILDTALELHPLCLTWSYSFLPGILEAVCSYCDESLARGNEKVKGTTLRDHIDAHNFRICNQTLCFSAQQFRRHLQGNLKANYDGTFFAGWTLLMKSSEQRKTAVFEAVEGVSSWRVHTDPEAAFATRQRQKSDRVPEARLKFIDLSKRPHTSSAPRKRIRRKPSAHAMMEAHYRYAHNSTVFRTLPVLRL